MNEERHFLEAISAGEPNADLIYADWLEEQGKPEADEIRDPTMIFLTSRTRIKVKSYSGMFYRFRFQSRSSPSSGPHFWYFTKSHSFSKFCYGYRSRLGSESGSWSGSWSFSA